MARAHYRQTVISKVPASGVLQIIPNPVVTVFEANSAVALAQTIYADATTGATLPNPFVGSADALVEFFLDAPQDVRILVDGAASGLDDVDLVQEPVFPPAAGILSRVFVADDSDYAFDLQQEDADGKIVAFRNPDGWPMFRIERSAGGNDVVSINTQNGSIPDNNLLVVASEELVSYVNALFIHNAQGTAGTSDSSALTAIALNTISSGNSLIRALEGRGVLLAPAVINGCWALELNVTSDVPGTIPTHLVGAFIGSGTTQPGEVPIDSGIWMGGPAAMKNFLYMTNTGGSLVARIAGGVAAGDSAGDVMTIANLYSTLTIGGAFRVGIVNHEAAGSGQTFAGLSYDAGSNINALIIGALTGGTGYRNILLAPSSGNVGIGISTAQLAAGVGGASAGVLPTMLYVDGAIGLATSIIALKTTIPTPNANYSTLGVKTDEFWYRKTSGGTEVKMTDASQITTLEAVGSSGAQTTTSASYADLANMTLTFTNCTAGDQIEVEFTGAFNHSVSRAAIVVALKHDANAETRAFAINMLPNAGDTSMITTHGVFTATAGTNVFKVRWLTGAATATANGNDRYLKGSRRPA